MKIEVWPEKNHSWIFKQILKKEVVWIKMQLIFKNRCILNKKRFRKNSEFNFNKWGNKDHLPQIQFHLLTHQIDNKRLIIKKWKINHKIKNGFFCKILNLSWLFWCRIHEECSKTSFFFHFFIQYLKKIGFKVNLSSFFHKI